MAEWLFPLQHTNTPQNNQMNLKTAYTYELNSAKCSLEILHGYVEVSDDSCEKVSFYVGDKALNEGIAKYLKRCKRQQQEAFIQALNDHIRNTENSH